MPGIAGPPPLLNAVVARACLEPSE